METSSCGVATTVESLHLDCDTCSTVQDCLKQRCVDIGMMSQTSCRPTPSKPVSFWYLYCGVEGPPQKLEYSKACVLQPGHTGSRLFQLKLVRYHCPVWCYQRLVGCYQRLVGCRTRVDLAVTIHRKRTKYSMGSSTSSRESKCCSGPSVYTVFILCRCCSGSSVLCHQYCVIRIVSSVLCRRLSGSSSNYTG